MNDTMKQVLVEALRRVTSMGHWCPSCGLRGVSRRATVRRLQRDDVEVILCGECARQPCTMNGVDQVLGFIPIEQPSHVAVAAEALRKLAAYEDSAAGSLSKSSSP